MIDKKKNGTKIHLTRTNISILMNKKEKILCTLRQNHYDSRKNDCSFFNSFFPCNFHLFDCLLLIVHWYLFCFLYSFMGKSLSSVSLFSFVSPGSSAWTVVVQPPSFVSSKNTRGPPKMIPNVAVPVKTSAGTRLYYALIKQLLQD